MKAKGTPVPGYVLNPKTGRLEKTVKRLDVSARIRQRKSKRTKVVKGGFAR